MKPDSFWRIPKIWPGRTVYILGGGPSLAAVDITRLNGQRVIACNQAYRLAPWIDAVCFMDLDWLRLPSNKQGLREFRGLKISAHKGHISDLGSELGIRVVNSKKHVEGISTDPDVVHNNTNTGAFAINVAVQLGAKRIILLGFDMQPVGGQNNYHADYPPPRQGQEKNPYPKFLARFPKIAESLKALGIECINATPGSALTVFPIADPESVMPPVNWDLRASHPEFVKRLEAISC